MNLGMYLGITGTIIVCSVSIISSLIKNNELLVEILSELKRIKAGD